MNSRSVGFIPMLALVFNLLSSQFGTAIAQQGYSADFAATVCEECDLFDAPVSIAEIQASTASYLSTFERDYTMGLANLGCNDEEGSECRIGKQQSLNTISGYMNASADLMSELKKVACLQGSMEMRTAPTCSIAGSVKMADGPLPAARHLRKEEERYVRGLQASVGIVKVSEDRLQIRDALVSANIAFAEEAALDVVVGLYYVLPECGGFSGDVCSPVTTGLKIGFAVTVIALNIALAVAQKKLFDINDGNEARLLEISIANHDNLIEANKRLLNVTEGLTQANDSLDMLLCPFGDEGLEMTILGQGCDGIDQNCDEVTDECEEDQVPPTIRLTKSPPKTPFKLVEEARSFLDQYIQVSDDCAAKLDVDIALANGPDCTECEFLVTATDERCVSFGGAANSTMSFVLRVDSTGPAIRCGFFLPQDQNSVPGGFDPCEGLSPPFPDEGDFLHIERSCFDNDLIDVEFWYQIETNDGDGVLPVEVTILSNELEGRPADNEMALIVERRDRGNGVNMVNRVRVLLAPFSCQDGGRGDSPICASEATADNAVTTRFYDIAVSAKDAAGNVGTKTCSVIVVPESLSTPGSSKSKPSRLADASSLRTAGKGSASKKSKKGVAVVEEPPLDLRVQYSLSSRKRLLTELSLLWDPEKDTTLTVPPLPELEIIDNSNGKGKSGVKGGSKVVRLCNRSVTCPSETTSVKSKKKGTSKLNPKVNTVKGEKKGISKNVKGMKKGASKNVNGNKKNVSKNVSGNKGKTTLKMKAKNAA